MVAQLSKGGHSAQVKMELLVAGGVIPVAQMGPDFLLINNPFDLPPGDASVTLRIDESERTWNIHLPEGISAGSTRVAISGRN